MGTRILAGNRANSSSSISRKSEGAGETGASLSGMGAQELAVFHRRAGAGRSRPAEAAKNIAQRPGNHRRRLRTRQLLYLLLLLTGIARTKMSGEILLAGQIYQWQMVDCRVLVW